MRENIADVDISNDKKFIFKENVTIEIVWPGNINIIVIATLD